MPLRIKILLFTFFFVAITTTNAQENNKLDFNMGFKVGFQAHSYNSVNIYVPNHNYTHTANQNSRIGYNFSTFFRLGKKRVFCQTEAVFSIENHNFSYQNSSLPDTETIIPINYKLTTYSIDIPFFIGYHFIKTPPYGMSIFTGPKVKCLLPSLSKQNFTGFPVGNINENLRRTTFGWEFGIGINISNIFFDFAYEIGMSNKSNGFFTPPTTGEAIIFNRKENTLSFSLGVIL